MGVTAPDIRWAVPADIPAMIPLMRALYAHDMPDAPPPHEDAMIAAHLDDLLALDTPHRLAVAFDADGAALGLAAVAIFVSVSDPRPENRRQMELKELFVRQDMRGAGLGAALLAWVEDEARARQASRMDWHVKRDNARGIAFYERFGGAVLSQRLSMRKALHRQ